MRAVIKTILVLGAITLPFIGCAPKRLGEKSGPAQWRANLQPPLDESSATSLRVNPSLHALIRLAMDRNPGLAAKRKQWLAAIHRQPQATSLPDPMAEGAGQIDDVMPGEDRQWNFGLRQELPWWQKLWARGEQAELGAEVARLQYETAVRDLLIDLKDTWYELYYLDQALSITRQIADLFRNQSVLAYSELTAERAALSEAFRAESQSAQLQYDLLLLQDQRTAQAERLRSLLNLPPDTAVGPVTNAPLYPVADDLPLLYSRAEKWAQVLKISGLEFERAQYETFLAQLERIPDVSLGWMYQANDPAMMGQSMQMLLGAMNLPIWEQRNRALVREKKAAEEAMELQALEELNQVRQAVAQAWFRVRLTKRLMELYDCELLPQAESIMRQAEIWYRGEQASFSSLLETTLAWHNFTLAYHRAIADHGQAIGRLERAIGATAEAARMGGQK